MRFMQLGNKIPKEQTTSDDATVAAAAAPGVPAVTNDLIDLNTELETTRKTKKQKRGGKRLQKPSGITIFKGSPIQTRSRKSVSIPKLDWLPY